MQLSLALAVVALAGCGRLSFSPVNLEDSGVDARVDGSVDGLDVDAPALSCVERWLAGTVMLDPQPVPNVNTVMSDYTPFLASDGATLYFSSNRAGAGTDDVFQATVAAGFADVAVVNDLSSTSVDGQITLSDNGLVATVSTDRPGLPAIGRNLWEATRASTQDAFSGFTGAPFANVNGDGQEYEHWTSPDRLRLYVSASSPTGEQNITLSTRATTAQPFSAPVLITELDTSESQCCHSLTADERVIIFVAQGPGLFEMRYATRASRAVPFSAPLAVPKTVGNDLHTALSGDGCTLYLSSARPGQGAFDLWVSGI